MNHHTSLSKRLLKAQAQGLCFLPQPDFNGTGLRTQRRLGTLLELLPGLFIDPTFWDSLKYEEKSQVLFQSVIKKHPRWIFAGTSAAWVHGFTKTLRILTPITVLSKNGTHPRQSLYVKRIYTGDFEYSSPENCRGVLVTPAVRTVFDCSRLLPLTDALPICDAALRAGKVTIGEVCAFADVHRHCHKWRRAIATMQLASPLAESGGESEARALMHILGFKEPQLQVEIKDPITHAVYRVDFLWELPDGHRVIGELDGKQKYHDPTMTRGRPLEAILKAEKQRESRLSIYDVRIMRFTYDILKQPSAFAELLSQFGIPRTTPLTF